MAEEFKVELDFIGVNMEKLYITFSTPIKKKCDDGKTITYKLRFIDSFRFMSTSLSELVDNMSGLENISDEGYAHAQKVWEVFEIKNCGSYLDLYVQSVTLFLADVFENFRNMCLEIYGLDPIYFVFAPRLA